MSNPNPVRQAYGRKPTDSASGVLNLTSKFVPRERQPNEALPNAINVMQQPTYKPAAWGR
jgi:hypothetical protein